MSNAEAAFGRRTFLKLSGAAAIVSGLQPLARQARPRSDPTHRLRIRRARVELAPGHLVTTTTYDDQLPGPLLRATVGQRTLVEIHNETDTTERIHWHGQNVRGEDETADIPAGSLRRMEFTPQRPGLYFYHSSQIAAACLDTGLYSGQVGALLVEPAQPTGRFGPESVLILKGCEPYLHRTARGCEVGYRTVMMQPVNLDGGETLLVHVLNACATDVYSLELPGHSFQVLALDGNAVPSPTRVAALCLSPGERVCARVEIGAAPRGERAQPVIRGVHSQGNAGWDYTRFGFPWADGRSRDVVEVLELVLARHDAARSGFNRWSLNGTSFSTSSPRSLFRLRHGLRYRLKISNTSDEVLPIHLQRHLLQIVSVAGRTTAGVLKDVVAIEPRQEAEVEFVADSPGPALLYCTRQLHRDFGLMALVDYA